ncbi:DUF3592 domain-containing protein [Streptomyces sp. SID8379]|uniref:DUF3592 domain-containing protein n=1 Tax=unclassified Streptomyces TaxID=2593676 RepID=UPI00036C121A|nr:MULTISPECIES: DUF3592 domain-containing protein [unclassified Streptomyces]MYW66043.1 DUF3592 domain-containing protein [Streptomyces sp. SID8379]
MSPLWLLALIPFLAGLALTAAFAVQVVTEALRRSTGTVIQATVTGHVASREATYAALHPVVSWTDADGTAHERALPDDATARTLPEGAPVRVRFDPARPDLASLDTDAHYRQAVTGVCLGMTLWVGTLIVVIWRIAYVLNDLRDHVSWRY